MNGYKYTCKNQGDKITTKNTKNTKGEENGNNKLFLFVLLVSFVVHFLREHGIDES